MSIDEFLLFCADVIRKMNLPTNKFTSRFAEERKEWIRSHGKEEEEEKEEEEAMLFTLYGTMACDRLKSRYNIDYITIMDSLTKRNDKFKGEQQKKQLEQEIAEKEFDIHQIDYEISLAEQENESPEQLEQLRKEKKELQDALKRMKMDLRNGNYTNSL